MAEPQQDTSATQSSAHPQSVSPAPPVQAVATDSESAGRPSSAYDDNHDQSDWVSPVPTDIVPPFPMSDIISDAEGPTYATDGTLESALFVLPFPAPLHAHRGKNTAPFLLSSPPREIYKKPAKNENGKRPKEKILKKVVRIWQEVAMGDKIKRGELENPTRIKKIRGGIIRVASTINKWLPNSCIETLSRLPPQSKLGTVTLIHPAFQQGDDEVVDEEQDRPFVPTPDELRNDMRVLLRKTRKRILKRAILSGVLLPISLGIDVFALVFAFEINVTNFAFQLYGLKKAKSLNASPKKRNAKRVKRCKKNAENASEQATLLVGNAPAEIPQDKAHESQLQLQQIFRTKAVASSTLDPILILMYDICAKIDPVSFPPRQEVEACNISSDSPPSSSATLPPNLKRPGGAVVKEMIEAFKQALPAEVSERYLLDEERVSEDLARYIKKASKEYIDSLNGWGDRKGVIHGIKTWRKKSIVKKEQAALIAREKRQAKKLKKEACN